MTVKSSISLTDAQAEFVRSLVEQGRYSSASAVIQQGLDLLRGRTEAEEVQTAALRLLLEERRSDAFISSDEMKDRINGMLERKRREHGLDP